MKTSDKIWLAGFFEGEGSCGFYNKIQKDSRHKDRVYKTKTLRVAIGQKYRKVLNTIRDLYGRGNVYLQKLDKSRFGKRMYKYNLSWHQAADFLEQIRPYMKAPHKIRQVDYSLSRWYRWRQRMNSN